MIPTIRVDIYLDGGPLDGSRIVVTLEGLGDLPKTLPYGSGRYVQGRNHTTWGARVYVWAPDYEEGPG